MNTVIAPSSSSESSPQPHEFSSFRGATDVVRMTGAVFSESQVRRLAHEVGAELVERRDRKVVSRRRRELSARVAVIPDDVALEHGVGRSRGPEQGFNAN